MKRFELTIFILAFSLIKVSSQIDYYNIRSLKLTPISIDTLNEPVVVIQKRFATIYFRQSDIKEYDKPYNVLGVRIDMNHKNIESLLSENKPYIRIIDWWFSYTENERNELRKKLVYSNQYEKFLNEFYYVGADLIHDGKFMIINNQTKKIVTKGLKIKRQDGLYGTKYVQFYMPFKKSFWYIVTAFGE